MAKFTVRIQLRDADSDDYEMLHDKMKAKGFYKIIYSSDGKRYRLPDAEYNYEKDKTRGEVLDIAFSIANSVKSDPAVLVTESAGRIWQGLESF